MNYTNVEIMKTFNEVTGRTMYLNNIFNLDTAVSIATLKVANYFPNWGQLIEADNTIQFIPFLEPIKPRFTNNGLIGQEGNFEELKNIVDPWCEKHNRPKITWEGWVIPFAQMMETIKNKIS